MSSQGPSKLNQLKIEAVAERISNEVAQSLSKLMQLWEKMGLSREALDERLQQAVDHHLKLQARFLEEEEQCLEAIKRDITDLEASVQFLSKKLDLKRDPVHSSKASLLEQRNLLEKQECQYTELCNKCLDEYNELLQTENGLCTLMGLAAEYQELQEEDLPKKETLTLMRQRIGLLDGKKNTLQLKMLRKHEIIEELASQLQLENDAIQDYMTLADLSEKGFLSKDNWIERHQQILEVNNRELKSLTTKLELLWDCFEIDRTARYAFLQTHRGIGAKTLEAFAAEICSYRRMKEQNVGRFLEKLRQELQTYWDKCFVSKELRDSFKNITAQRETTIDTLDLYESEVAKWKEHYSTHSAIFELYMERSQLKSKANVLKKKTTDPNRFRNRGANLLKEEKEWKRLNAILPKLDKTLADKALAYEEETGQPFRVNGKTLLEELADPNNPNSGPGVSEYNTAESSSKMSATSKTSSSKSSGR